MTNPTTLAADRDGILLELRNLAAKAEAEGRDFTDDERATVTDRMAKARAIQDQLTAQRVSKALQDDLQEFLTDAAAHELNGDALAGAGPLRGRRVKSLGEYFTGSEQFKSLMAKAPGGEYPTGSNVQMSPVPVAGGLKALIGTDPAGNDSGAGTLWDPERIPTVQATWPQLQLRNVITVGTTSSDAVQYARVLRAGAGGSTNSADGVPEAVTAAAVGSGDPAVTSVQAGVKPESALKFEKVTAPVVTVAHWVPATKKALSDAGQLRTLIDNFLRSGLEQELERQMLLGDSSAGEEFDGLVNTDGIQTQAFDTNILVAIRKAITKVNRYGRPNAVLMSPANAERIDLLRTSTGQYLGGGAFGPANPTVWRRPVIEVPGLNDSTVLVGDFTTAVVWDREAASVTISDSHADFFVRNLVAILAEARAAFGVLDPALICKVTVTGTDVIVPA